MKAAIFSSRLKGSNISAAPVRSQISDTPNSRQIERMTASEGVLKPVS
nr:MAG TPA: hypothetical protein [Caudoviricetes sp.]